MVGTEIQFSEGSEITDLLWKGFELVAREVGKVVKLFFDEGFKFCFENIFEVIPVLSSERRKRVERWRRRQLRFLEMRDLSIENEVLLFEGPTTILNFRVKRL